jgi:outer membrane lipoprotein-sorting protein
MFSTVCTLLVFCQGTPPSGRAILSAMHDRYAGSWYRTLTFVQRNTATAPDGAIEHSTWLEYAALPGRLRIEFQPPDSSAGILFVRDSQFVFKRGTLSSATAFVHPLMVLGFDVYFDSAERTVTRLEQLGFDLATVHEDSWQGRAVYVVGARAGDQHRRQFWVDKERLVFVRILEPGQRDTTRTSDIRFNDYRPSGAAWISAEVEFLVDGKQRWLEQYSDIRTGTALPDSLFDPRRWAPQKN